ncbi:MAG: hypothetical protein J3K34DRAFT_415821, partial [Monoraphidium minutum]
MPLMLTLLPPPPLSPLIVLLASRPCCTSFVYSSCVLSTRCARAMCTPCRAAGRVPHTHAAPLVPSSDPTPGLASVEASRSQAPQPSTVRPLCWHALHSGTPCKPPVP